MNNCQNDDIIITVDENSDDVILVEENTVLPEKKKNIFSEFFSIFPVHACLCFLYIVTAITLAVLGTLLLINASMGLELLQLTCSLSGVFLWLLALYLFYVIYVYMYYALLLGEAGVDYVPLVRLQLFHEFKW